MKFLQRCVLASWILGPLVLGSSCSPDTNLNKIIFSNSAQQNSTESKLSRARMAYDRGNYDEAEKLALELYNYDPDSEKIVVLLGYIYLSRAGLDAFTMTGKLINQQETKKAANDTSKNAVGTLSGLSVILSLTDADTAKLGANYAGDQTAFFSDIKLLNPTEPAVARQEVSTLLYATKAITTVCPFVNHDGTDVIAAGDERHDCAANTSAKKLTAKTHFLWSIAHLAEALAFNSILLYSDDPEGTSNLQRRSGKINTTTFEGDSAITQFLGAMDDMVNATNAVLQSDKPASESQLQAVLNDLQATAGGFGQMPGIPDEVVKAITDGLEELRNLSKKLGGAQGELNPKALKGQFIKQNAETVAGKIKTVFEANPDMPQAKKDEACASLDKFYDGVPAADQVAVAECS